MRRRCFDHLHAELSVEIGRLVPRYALWISLQEAGYDPDALAAHQLRRYLDERLGAFLLSEDLELTPKRLERLRRRLRRFDPNVPTPYETMQRIFAPPT